MAGPEHVCTQRRTQATKQGGALDLLLPYSEGPQHCSPPSCQQGSNNTEKVQLVTHIGLPSNSPGCAPIVRLWTIENHHGCCAEATAVTPHPVPLSAGRCSGAVVAAAESTSWCKLDVHFQQLLETVGKMMVQGLIWHSQMHPLAAADQGHTLVVWPSCHVNSDKAGACCCSRV